MTSSTRWWAVCSLGTALCLLLMLLHRSDDPTFLGRYSATYAVQLGIMVVMMAASLGLLRLALRGKLPNFDAYRPHGWKLALASGLGLVGLMALWWLLPGARQQPAIALFSAYLVVVGSSILLWMGRASTTPLPPAFGPGLLVLSLAITIGLAVLYMGHVPASLLYDEPWMANQGYAMFQTGVARIPMYPQSDAINVLRQPMVYVAMGGWLSAFGMSLTNARWFWWLVGAASVPFLYATARRVYGMAGAIAAAVIGLSLLLLHTYLRADFAVVLALAVALWALSEGQARQSWGWYVLAGAAVAATVEGHMLSVRWVVAFGLMITLDYARILWTSRRWCWHAPFWAFMGGGLLFTGLFLYFHSLAWGVPLDTYLNGLSGVYTAEAGLADASIYGEGLIRIVNIAQAWFIDYVAIHPLEVALGLLILLYWSTLGRKQEQERQWRNLFLVGTLGMLVLLPKPSAYYWVHHLPFIALGGAGLLGKVSGAIRDRITWAWVVGVLLIVGMTTINILWTADNNAQNADQAIALGYQLDQILPPEIQRIAGRQPYYYGLAERDFVNIETFHVVEWKDWQADMGILPPQAVLVTRGWDDPYPAVFDYLDEAGFVRVACFPLDIYSKAADLYMRPQDITPQLQLTCDL